MDLRGKRLLLIGGAGFIGSHVADELLASDVAEIRIYDNFSRGCIENLAPALRDSRVRVFSGGGDILHRDVLDAAMKNVDGVFHFAALWLLQCHEYPRSAVDVNIGGTYNVLEAAIKNGVRRLVFSSSASVYGDAVEEPMTEDHPFHNRTLYGATKIAGEQIIRAQYHRFHGTPQAFEYTALRYMNVYGPRQDYQGAYIAVIMKMLDRLDRGLAPVIYGDGSQAYDFVYVSDCARANVLAMQSEVSDEVFNVGTGIRTTLRELAGMLIELTGRRVEIAYQPAGLTFVKNRIGSTDRAGDRIGFEARQQLRDGLRRLIEWRCAHREEVARRRREAGFPDAG